MNMRVEGFQRCLARVVESEDAFFSQQWDHLEKHFPGHASSSAVWRPTIVTPSRVAIASSVCSN